MQVLLFKSTVGPSERVCFFKWHTGTADCNFASFGGMSSPPGVIGVAVDSATTSGAVLVSLVTGSLAKKMFNGSMFLFSIAQHRSCV